MSSGEGLLLAFRECSANGRITGIMCPASQAYEFEGNNTYLCDSGMFMKQNSLTALQSHFSQSTASSGLRLFLCKEFLLLGFSLQPWPQENWPSEMFYSWF